MSIFVFLKKYVVTIDITTCLVYIMVVMIKITTKKKREDFI